MISISNEDYFDVIKSKGLAGWRVHPNQAKLYFSKLDKLKSKESLTSSEQFEVKELELKIRYWVGEVN